MTFKLSWWSWKVQTWESQRMISTQCPTMKLCFKLRKSSNTRAAEQRISAYGFYAISSFLMKTLNKRSLMTLQLWFWLLSSWTMVHLLMCWRYLRDQPLLLRSQDTTPATTSNNNATDGIVKTCRTCRLPIAINLHFDCHNDGPPAR